MATHQACKPSAEQGYRNLWHDGLIKATRGETTIEEVMRVAGTSVPEEEGAEI